MKKFLALIILIAAFTSCTQDPLPELLKESNIELSKGPAPGNTIKCINSEVVVTINTNGTFDIYYSNGLPPDLNVGLDFANEACDAVMSKNNNMIVVDKNNNFVSIKKYEEYENKCLPCHPECYHPPQCSTRYGVLRYGPPFTCGVALNPTNCDDDPNT